MELTVGKADLQKELQLCQGVVEKRSTIPILSNVLMKAADGKLQIAKVNIDDNDAVAAEYGVRAIPTMILFKGGKVAETLVGMMPKAALKAKLAAHVA